MKKFAIGDIHGQLESLEQCLERSGFDKSTDRLICLGDVCDRGPKVLECIQLLASIPNLVYVMGNHDWWTRMWIDGKFEDIHSPDVYLERKLWLNQGGMDTHDSISNGNGDENKKFVTEFFDRAVYFHLEKNQLFVHGGIRPELKVEYHSNELLMWDRTLIQDAKYNALSRDNLVKEYDEVFIGHTPFESVKHYSNVWALDTGSGKGGKLTIMNIDTKECWQSDLQEKKKGK